MEKNRPNLDQAGPNSLKDDLESMKIQATSVRETLHDARDEVQRKAGEYASEAKAAAFKQAEGAQKGIGETMAAFGGAIRAASDHLAKGDQTAMSKLMNDAAGGIELFSDSLQNKKFDEILDDVRQLGRDNSGALLAGSILAGLALGRFVKSSGSPAHIGEPASQNAGRNSAPWTSTVQGNSPGTGESSRSSDDLVEVTNISATADRPWPSQQKDSLSSDADVFSESGGEKRS